MQTCPSCPSCPSCPVYHLRSRMPNGEEDKCSIHEADKVLRGTKWIATRWCRESP